MTGSETQAKDRLRWCPRSLEMQATPNCSLTRHYSCVEAPRDHSWPRNSSGADPSPFGLRACPEAMAEGMTRGLGGSVRVGPTNCEIVLEEIAVTALDRIRKPNLTTDAERRHTEIRVIRMSSI